MSVSENHVYTITLARPGDLGALAEIEMLAGQMLRGYLPDAVLAETTPQETFRAAQEEGRLWVALADGIPVGFALVEMLAADLPHLAEMDVTPAHGRRGLGTSLLQAILAWLAGAGQQQLTLTTSRAAPWNRPFYARFGFEEMQPGELRPELVTVVQDEADRGLDPSGRVVMRYRVGHDDGA